MVGWIVPLVYTALFGSKSPPSSFSTTTSRRDDSRSMLDDED
jgi:hypothetical protein